MSDGNRSDEKPADEAGGEHERDAGSRSGIPETKLPDGEAIADIGDKVGGPA